MSNKQAIIGYFFRLFEKEKDYKGDEELLKDLGDTIIREGWEQQEVYQVLMEILQSDDVISAILENKRKFPLNIFSLPLFTEYSRFDGSARKAPEPKTNDQTLLEDKLLSLLSHITEEKLVSKRDLAKMKSGLDQRFDKIEEMLGAKASSEDIKELKRIDVIRLASILSTLVLGFITTILTIVFLVTSLVPNNRSNNTDSSKGEQRDFVKKSANSRAVTPNAKPILRQ